MTTGQIIRVRYEELDDLFYDYGIVEPVTEETLKQAIDEALDDGDEDFIIDVADVIGNNDNAHFDNDRLGNALGIIGGIFGGLAPMVQGFKKPAAAQPTQPTISAEELMLIQDVHRLKFQK